MTKFRKKPIDIEAIRWTGTNLADIKRWMALRHNEHSHRGLPQDIHYFVKRRSTGMTEELWKNIADPDWDENVSAAVYDYLHQTYVGVLTGQWIMCGTEGEFYPSQSNEEGTAPLNYEVPPALDADAMLRAHQKAVEDGNPWR